MPTKLYSLESGGPKRLEVSWKGVFKNTTVKLNGVVIGAFSDKAALMTGQLMALPGGATLHVRLVSSMFATHLEMLLDGRPVPGSPTDPVMLVRGAGQLLYFIASLNAFAGSLVLLFDVHALEALVGEGGVGGFVMAFVYSVLAYFSMGGSAWALGIAAALMTVDGLAGLAMAISAGGGPGIGALMVRVLLVVHVVRAFKAARSMRTGASP